ncbi:MAG: hypothetical protein J1F60_00605 [Oscillospiraceae bacterium]|nr:hypothetical protein [Oscillospiraceae bacterium]
MYSVSSVSLQNIYAPSAAARSSLKKDGSAAFDYELYGRVNSDTTAERIIDDMTAAGIFKTEEEEEEKGKAVDELLKAIKEHQKTWKEEVFGIKKSGLTVEEVKEVLSELKCTNRVTAK